MNSKFKCTASKELLKRLDFESLLPEILLMLKKSYSCQPEFVFFQVVIYPVILIHCLCTVIKSGSANCSFPVFKFHSGYVLSLTLAKRVGSEL